MKKKIISIVLAVLGIVFLVLFVIAFRKEQELRPEYSRESATDYAPETSSGEITTVEGGDEQSGKSESCVTESEVEESESGESSLEEADKQTSSETEQISDIDSSKLGEAVENPYAEFFAAYEDMKGWLVIPDTKVDEPVMWTPADENYYLLRNYKKKDDKNGSLILDTDSCVDPLTTNLIIHGHNMKSGKMFGTLKNYEKQKYAEQHPYIYLYTQDRCLVYEVLAVFRSQVFRKKDTCFKYYNFFQADSEAEFDDFYQNIKNLSLYETGVTASYGDRFITLSTCAYHVENGRFVVVGKEIEQRPYISLSE